VTFFKNGVVDLGMFMPSDTDYRWSETIIRETCEFKELLTLKVGDILIGGYAGLRYGTGMGMGPERYSYLVLEERKEEHLFIPVLFIERNQKTKINVCWDVYHLGQIEKIIRLDSPVESARVNL